MSDSYQFCMLSYDDLMGVLKAKYGDDADGWRIASVTSTTDMVAAERIQVYVRPVEVRTVVSGPEAGDDAD